MTIEEGRAVNKFLGNRPYAFNSSGIRPRRRSRLPWSTWSVTARPGVEVKEQEDLFRVTLTPRKARPVNSWFDSGWAVRADFDVLPTLTKPVAVKKAQWHTPGDNTASEETFARWRADMHRRPPIHYQRKYLLERKDSSGKVVDQRFSTSVRTRSSPVTLVTGRWYAGTPRGARRTQ